MAKDRSNKFVGTMGDLVSVDETETKGPSLAKKMRDIHNDRRYAAMSPSEQKAVDNTLTEAEANGANLRSDGLGGLPASLALGVYRRDRFQCKRCGTKKDISLHHKGGIKTSRHAYRGKKNDLTNLVVLCKPCHGVVHNEDN